MTEREEQMARIKPHYPGVCNSSRLDTLLRRRFQVSRITAETPAGITDQMQIEKLFRMIPEVREF